MNRPQPFELAVPIDGVDHSRGPDHAPIALLEYGDFECPNCKQAAPAVTMILSVFSNRVRFVYRHFPLEEVHPHALLAAEATEAAGAQDKFWDMHDLLYANQLHLGRQHLLSYAERLELDMPRFITDLNDEIYRQRVREHLAGGRKSGVRGTPTFFINGEIHDVSYGVHTLYDAVATALQARA